MTVVETRAARSRPLPTTRSPAAELMARARLHLPEESGHHLRRERLSGLLGASDAPLVLLSAPAGAGKTALAVEWAHRLAGVRRVVWVSCHRREAGPWVDVARGVGAAPGPAPAGQPAGSGLTGTRVAEILEAVAGSPVPWTVFLDGYDLRSAEEAAQVDGLLASAGEALQVVVTTRADPVLPLHRYRLEGRLLEVRAADLAFTDEEAGALLRAGGVVLAQEERDALNERLAGWAAGLRFALWSLSRHPAPGGALASATAHDGNINAFLVEEVLDAQPPDLRELILITSVPDTLTPGLLEALTGEPAALTTIELMRANVFLEQLPGDEGCLRYVPCFRDLVRAQLAHEAPARLRRLHGVAAQWYAAHGTWDHVIAHLDLAGDRPDCGTLLADHLLVGRVLCEQPGDPVRRLVANTPRPGTGPADHLLTAALALADGEHAVCATHLDAARAGGAATSQRHAATLTVLDAVLSGLAGDARRTEHLAGRAEAALAARGAEAPGAVDTRAVLLLARAVSALRLGAVQRAGRLLDACLDGPTAAWSEDYRGVCLAHAALLHAREGSFARATEEACEAVAVSHRGDGSALTTVAHLSRAHVALVAGDHTGARAHLAEACPHPEPLWTVVRAVVAAALERDDGSPEVARARLTAALGPADDAGPWAAGWVREQLGPGTHHQGPTPSTDDGTDLRTPRAAAWPVGTDGRVVEPLTPREVEVLAAMSEWLTTEEIAEKLFVSVNTVRTHVRNILTKLGVSRRNAAIREALRLGLLAPDPRVGAPGATRTG